MKGAAGPAHHPIGMMRPPRPLCLDLPESPSWNRGSGMATNSEALEDVTKPLTAADE
jgi:hypothetical protein